MRRSPRTLVLLSAVVLLVASCGGEDKTQGQLAREALNRGLAAQQAGDADAAGEAYREALDHDPENAYAFFNLGLLAQSEDRLAEAEENYRATLNADPAFSSALYNLATIRYGQGAKLESADLYRQVLELEPSNANAHLNLGFSLHDLGEDERATAEFQKAVLLDPTLTERIPEDVHLAVESGKAGAGANESG
jgi:tetratricopeptide (TPR) repeat protein